MLPQEFEKKIQDKAAEIKYYANNQFPAVAGNIALRFINGNFRVKGFQGTFFQSWKNKDGKSITLVQKGHLRSANYYPAAQRVPMKGCANTQLRKEFP